MRISDRFKGREAYSPGGKPCPVVLNANESFVRPSAELMEEFQAILANCDFNRYPDPRATALCQAFADLFKVDWQNVTAGNGSDELIAWWHHMTVWSLSIRIFPCMATAHI